MTDQLSKRAKEIARRLGGIGGQAGQIAQAVGVFAPLGWAMCGRWHVAGTLRVLEMAENGAQPTELDTALADLWNMENGAWMRNAAAPMRAWANDHLPLKKLLWERATVIERAVAYHQDGSYDAAIPMLLAQIDGLSFDLSGKSFFSSGNTEPFVDDETLAGLEGNLPVVRSVFSAPVRASGMHGLVSRHGVMHGRDLAYPSRENSTKTIVLVVALAEYWPPAARRSSVTHRRQHETEVAGATTLDELGRLVDDREIPEVRRAAYDIAAAYGNAILMAAQHVFDLETEIAAASQRHGLDPDRFTRDRDRTGWWWAYRVPARQVLGYASRPSTSTERRWPDVWRWDAQDSPSSPPWQSPQGWRPDDQVPRSPNWEWEPI